MADASLELEIKSLLDELGQPSLVAERLIPFIEESEENFVPDKVNGLCLFLLKAGLFRELQDFILKHLASPGFRIPWAYFLDAIQGAHPQVDDALADYLLEGLEEHKAYEEACLSKALDLQTPLLKQQRADRRLQRIKAYRALKDELLEQLVTLRTQQLFEQEKALLAKLLRMYPKDPQVVKESRSQRERTAMDVLSRRGGGLGKKKSAIKEPPPDAETEKAADEFLAVFEKVAKAQPALAFDLAIAFAFLDKNDHALKLLDGAPESAPVSWLRLELFLRARRYLELLNDLARVELLYAEDPETFAATAYLRAQAMWGLGQRDTAIEVLESLLASNPQYRAAPSLIQLWRDA